MKGDSWRVPEAAAGDPELLRVGALAETTAVLSTTQVRKADAIAAMEGIGDQLDAEAKEDESARRQYGSRWPMAASYVANGELRDRLSGYR